MWPRIVEVVLGIWLIIGPFVFRLGPEERAVAANHVACGAAIVILALIAIPVRFVHLLVFVLSLWLIAFGYFAGGYPSAPGYQNLMVTGMVLSFMGIILSDHLQPTVSWRKYYRSR